MLLARLGVSADWQGKASKPARAGCNLTYPQAADIAGIRALAVHAKDDVARSFYRRFDFEEPPIDPLHLFALIKDLRSL